MPTKLILIRHGITNCNKEKKYQGFLDTDLNAKGKNQARLLHGKIKQEKIHKVYSSDRKRALQTAKIIFESKRITKTADLREMHFGIFEGLTCAQIMKTHSRIYKRWFKDPFSVTIPGGENLHCFKKRVINAFRKITSHNYNKTMAVICHGGVIGIFLTHILKTKDFWKQIPRPASITVIIFKDGKYIRGEQYG
ncbi:MAG: histidine phosphatase family protein [Candidatus Omnitrophica bacterium]|nr:histidine phosphatase family protein [Candidatus Omnitrophota bacterium]MBU4473297.1 histidine phosphatase family protein [Candidatus Omnitrophota bacterium]MCG2706592.1 histidine phosphatase family protein [Candidatus Omnitrophota bacterium]